MPITQEQTKRLKPNVPYPETVRALAERWGPFLDVPVSWIVSHAYVESSNRPLVYNPRGNAWGLMQMKLGTAEDAVRILRGKHPRGKDPRVTAVLRCCWRGQGENLWNPELAVVLSAAYLWYLKQQFGEDHKLVAAAYNQGPGSVRKALKTAEKKGVPVEQAFTKDHHHYLAKIQEAKDQGYA